jgi:hypothetical protein
VNIRPHLWFFFTAALAETITPLKERLDLRSLKKEQSSIMNSAAVAEVESQYQMKIIKSNSLYLILEIPY